jgi:hypothetical protein
MLWISWVAKQLLSSQQEKRGLSPWNHYLIQNVMKLICEREKWIQLAHDKNFRTGNISLYSTKDRKFLEEFRKRTTLHGVGEVWNTQLLLSSLFDMYSYLTEHFGTSGNCADSVDMFKRCVYVRFQTCSILTHIRLPPIQLEERTRLIFSKVSPHNATSTYLIWRVGSFMKNSFCRKSWTRKFLWFHSREKSYGWRKWRVCRIS